MDIKEKLNLHHDPREVNLYFEDISKMLNIAKNNYHKTRDLIIDNTQLLNSDKKKILDMLDCLYQKKSKDLPTTDYEEKPYTQLFFRDFLSFIKTENLRMNELKIIMAIYDILEEKNTFGNVLLNASKKLLSDKTGINITNIQKDIKSLIAKKILIRDEYESLYLNYRYFFRGTKKDYDVYSGLYERIKEQPVLTNDNLELPNLDTEE